MAKIIKLTEEEWKAREREIFLASIHQANDRLKKKPNQEPRIWLSPAGEPPPS